MVKGADKKWGKSLGSAGENTSNMYTCNCAELVSNIQKLIFLTTYRRRTTVEAVCVEKTLLSPGVRHTGFRQIPSEDF